MCTLENYSVVKYNSSYFDIWNDFVAKSKNATFLFHRDFMDYHSDRFEDHSLLIYKDDTLVALFPANKVDSTLISHQGLSYGGLLCLSAIKLEEYLLLFCELLEDLNANGIEKIQIKSIPNMYSNILSEEFEYVNFLIEGCIYRTDVLLVIEQNKQLKLSKDRVRGVKNGFKNEFYVEENGDFASFWNKILIPNLNTKFGVNPVHTLEEIEMLHSKFPSEIRQFNIYNKEGEIIAGLTIFETDKVAHSQYTSGIKEWNSKGAVDYLYNYLLEVVFKDKAFFDFGNCNVSNGKKLNKGLLYWKESFGARSIAQNFYEIETKNFEKLKDIWI